MRTIGKLLLAFLLPNLAFADPDPAMMSKLQAMYPKTKISQVSTTAVPGITEVVMGQNIAYVNESGRYFLFGRLYDMKEQKDLTQARLEDVQKADVKDIDTSLAIRMVQGDGSRSIYVFSDPECPYCKQLDISLSKLDNVTIYLFLLPLESIHPKSREKAIAIWCSKDRAIAWNDYMTKGVYTKSPVKCDNPIDKIGTLAMALGINGTPTLISSDGRKMSGARDVAAINTWLDQGLGKKTASIKE